MPWLIITRKLGESFALGEDVTIVIKNVRGKNVELAINAPEFIRVKRLDKESGRVKSTKAPPFPQQPPPDEPRDAP